jgi:hypothetical protein
VSAQQKQDLEARILRIQGRIPGLERRRQAAEDALRELTERGRQYEVLGRACDALDELETMGAGALFWGEKPAVRDIPAHMARARALAGEHRERIAAAENDCRALKDQVQAQRTQILLLGNEIAEIEEEEELARDELAVERELAAGPYRPMVMPWAHHGEDQRRFRRSLLLALLLMLLFSTFVELWVLPERDVNEVVEIPERLVRLAQKAPPPPPKPVEKRPEQKEDKSRPAETQQARAKAEQSGVLAFKSAFRELMSDTPDNLGASAQVRSEGRQGTGQTQRSLVTAQAQAGSGGIGNAAISRNVAGTGSRLGGVGFTRVQSDVGAAGGGDRPLSGGLGPSRTDEEIQIVFDRYKAALYRIYNRELRSNPTLRGKVILRITIEPDGSVSACRVESTDLASRELTGEVVERVRKFNFGPKDGVPRLTILYPIDFLPATG